MASKELREENTKAFEDMLVAIPEDKISLIDTFSLASIEPERGRYYFGANCERCERFTPVLSDVTKGRRGKPFSGAGEIKIQCYYCPNEIKAGAEELLSFRWQ